MPPFMPMHPAYAAAGRMPFVPPMMPFFGQMPPPFLPPNSPGMPAYAAGGPGMPAYPVGGPGGMFPFMPAASVASLSTVASSVVTPTSVVWAAVSHPVPSPAVQQTGSVLDVHRSSLSSQTMSTTASSGPTVAVSTSPAFTSATPSQATVPAAAAVAHVASGPATPSSTSPADTTDAASSHTGNSQAQWRQSIFVFLWWGGAKFCPEAN